MTAQNTCIYCRVGEHDTVFTREHVLQDGFGTFRDALLLHDCVCHSCNQYFGQTIDLAVTRESPEGFERYIWGIRQPEEVRNFRRNSMTWELANFGDYSGVPLRPVNGPAGLGMQPISGIAVHNRENDQFTHFSLEETLTGAWNVSTVDCKAGVRFFGTEEELTRMQLALRDQGVVFQDFIPLDPPPAQSEVDVLQVARITESMNRGIAKIAFNYLAKMQGADFALLDSFNPVRRYVRYGEQNELPFVHASPELPFRSNFPDEQRPVIHWLCITGHEQHRNLLGQVVLFGFRTHNVMLAENFPGPWFDLPIAHAYNVRTRHVEEQQPTRPRWRHR